MENNENIETEEVLDGPAKVEKISLSDIQNEIQKQKDEATDDLVRRIMTKILKIKED